VLISDTSGKRIILLHDANNDGLFDNATERTTYFSNPGSIMGDVRHLAILPVQGDLNHDELVNFTDVNLFMNVLTDVEFGAYAGRAADVNKDGSADGRDVQRMTQLLVGP